MTMSTQTRGWIGTAAMVTIAAMLASGTTLSAQTNGMTFKATASVKAPGKSVSVPITIRIDRFISDADRDKVVAAVKAQQSGEPQKTLAALPDVGLITVGAIKTPVKYAYARATGAGRLITVVTAKPVYFVGGNEPNAKPKAGYDIALALLVLDANDTGDGEFAPAVKVKVDQNGSVVTDDYGVEVVRLTKIAKGN
jgi:hypothetical protein